MTPFRFRLVDALLILAILAGAGGVRAWYLQNCANQGGDEGPIVVQAPTPDLAADRAEPSSATGSPLYPWFAWVTRQAAADPAQGDRLVRWIQGGLGALTAGLLYLAAARAFGSRLAALLAGVLAAVYPFWVADTAQLADGAVATFLMAVCLCLGSGFHRPAGFLSSWFFGLALAALALVRTALIPFAWVAILWYLFQSRRMTRGWLYAFLAFLGFVTALVPWAVRNYRQGHEPLPVVHTAYRYLWEGNNPQATGGAWKSGAGETADQGDRELGEAAWREVRGNPAGTLQRRLWAGLCFFFGEDWLTRRNVWQEREGGQAAELPLWLREIIPTGFYGFLLGLVLFALLGWRWSYGRGSAARLLAIAAVWVPLPYLLGHADALHGPRLPLDAALIAFAALGVAGLFGAAPAVRPVDDVVA